MNVLYIFLAGILIGTGAGSFGMHKLDEVEILQAGIDRDKAIQERKDADTAAQIKLGEVMIDHQQAEAKKRDYLKQLEKSRENYSKDMAARTAELDSIRLYSATADKKDCGSGAESGAGTGIDTGRQEADQRAAEIDRLVKEIADQCDTLDGLFQHEWQPWAKSLNSKQEVTQ